MATVTTSVEASAGSVQINWIAPADGSDTITAYLIEIYDGTSAWSASTACDGADATILAARSCTIAMTVLTASPHSLAFDALVQVRASAYNSYGWGAVSATNTAGARIR